MTRTAARRGFETLLEELSEAAIEEFDVGAALEGSASGPAGKAIDRLVGESRLVRREVVRPELRTYREDTLDQFDVLLEYVEDDVHFNEYVDDVLAEDRFVDALRPDVSRERRAEVLEWLAKERHALASAVEPIVGAPEPEFWPAVRTAFDREEARAFVDEQFRLAEPFRRHGDAFAFQAELDPGDLLGGPLTSRLPTISVEYTTEAARALEHAERTVLEETNSEIERRFD